MHRGDSHICDSDGDDKESQKQRSQDESYSPDKAPNCCLARYNVFGCGRRAYDGEYDS